MLKVDEFVRIGPTLSGRALLSIIDGRFAVDADFAKIPLGASLEKVAASLNRGAFAEAAIRSSQIYPHLLELKKNGFDPDQPRNSHGEWNGGSDKTAVENHPAPREAVSVGYCKIVKQLCIAEATETLPTGSSDGMPFFRAYNACMDRHGCLGVA